MSEPTRRLITSSQITHLSCWIFFLVWIFSSATPVTGDTTPVTAPETKKKILYWYDPMYPGTQFPAPGKSPFMDMDLVPRYADEEGRTGIFIDPRQTQNLGLKTVRARRGTLLLSRMIPANVLYNGHQISRIQPRAEGFVEKTAPLAIGDRVQAGDILAWVTVPAWASDQSEYLLLKKQKAPENIIAGVREKLYLAGMPQEMLQAVDETGLIQTTLKITSPISGVITSLDLYPGMNVEKNMTLAVIQGIDPVWVVAYLPEKELALSQGRMRLTLPSYPGRVFPADKVEVLPYVDEVTRALPLRLSVPNPEGLLRPGQTANLSIRATGAEGILVPTQSLIHLGDEARVITRAPDQSFVPKKVTPGASFREETLITHGLDEGEEVVTVGLFLIDSEANLRGALDRLGATEN
ncbi:MAG: efflux RND transporter periplasmic adaptor subunit [Deltaproteobacteria bacterium]|jgi:Cu(I)/Ag(I) efflux system membrane fusion protein|nr:efflux RND transporter periplasmic adaptor subunit [Deltaproteobacteria bacterium]